MENKLPPPYEESNGIYALTSRIVRPIPPRFVWGCKSRICDMVVRHEQLVNHFQKGRYFSSKIGLTNCLKDLPWINSADQNSFFPRSYVLNEDDKDDFIEDFRQTTCIGLLKNILKFYCTTVPLETQASFRRENSKYEEIRHDDHAPISTLEDITSVNIKSPIVEEGEVEIEKEEIDIECKVQKDKLIIPDSSVCQDEDISQAEMEPTAIETENIVKEPLKKIPDFNETKRKKTGGNIPQTAVEYALKHLNYLLACRNHDDIEHSLSSKILSKSQWSSLINWSYRVQHDGAIVTVTESLLREAKDCLKKYKKILAQFELDGSKNLWIIKPGDKSKGIGIEFSSKLDYILKYISTATTIGTYIVQKYVERPLLIHGCKFDIRQWFLVTDWNPLTIWFYTESYLRICSQQYDSENMHESIHLSNVAVQQFYENSQSRSSSIPDTNFMTSTDFKNYLVEHMDMESVWESVIYPCMKEAVINCLLATQDVTEMRKTAFELYGADFILTEDFHPWLLEINSSPGMAATCLEKIRLCSAVIDDTIKVVIDRREDKNCSTGNFELAFKSHYVNQPRCVEPKMLISGQKIKRLDIGRYGAFDAYFSKKEKQRDERENRRRQLESKEDKHQSHMQYKSNAIDDHDQETITVDKTQRHLNDEIATDEVNSNSENNNIENKTLSPRELRNKKSQRRAAINSPLKPMPNLPHNLLQREKQLAQIYTGNTLKKG